MPFGLAMAVMLVQSLSTLRAHHSISAFDIESEISVSGVVVDFQWANPHTWLTISPAGNPDEVVGFEGMSADYLGRRGWQRRSLNEGDSVEVVYFPRRDGSAGGLVISVRLGDGTLRVMIDND